MTPHIYAALLCVIAWYDFPALIALASGYHSMHATDPLANTIFIFSTTWMLFGFYSAFFYALIAYAYAYVHSSHIRDASQIFYEQAKMQFVKEFDITPDKYLQYITPVQTTLNTVETYLEKWQVQSFLERLDVTLQSVVAAGSSSSVHIRPTVAMIKEYVALRLRELNTPAAIPTVVVTDDNAFVVKEEDVIAEDNSSDDLTVPSEENNDMASTSELQTPDIDYERTTPDIDPRIIYSAS